MKKLMLAIGLGLISGSVYAACFGPVCYDDSGLYIMTAPGLPSVTVAQMNQLEGGYTGRIIYVSDATRSKICVSSGTAKGAWILPVSTGVFAAGSLEHCI